MARDSRSLISSDLELQLFHITVKCEISVFEYGNEAKGMFSQVGWLLDLVSKLVPSCKQSRRNIYLLLASEEVQRVQSEVSDFELSKSAYQ